jgi:ribosomal protein S18 acetylase RimI-like enzyme
MSTTPHLAVRAAEASDGERLTELLAAQLEEHQIPTARSHIAKSVALMLADPDRGFLLAGTVAGSIEAVAYISFATPLEHAGEVAWLEELYVAPEHRNLGLGKRLVDAVAERAEARGCVSIELEVTADHFRAARLYEREGFRSLRRDHMARPLSKWDW